MSATLFCLTFYYAVAFHIGSAELLNEDGTLIRTKSGLVQGTKTDTVRMFRSIPYAEAPVGELRWSEPQYVENWDNDTVNATDDPPGCPQICVLPPHSCPPTVSEDCLFLNIFTPNPINSSSIAALPVLVFIHGGNFKQGYSGGLLYNASNLVTFSNIVVVTLNYRLGVLGQLWSIEAGMSGNYGFKDQQLALLWIYNNIAFFGGDATRVSIFGQSAGAVSVALHLMQTDADHSRLFQYALMESEPFGTPLRDTTTWGALPKSFFDKVGCAYDEFSTKDPQKFWQCLRDRNMSQILNAQNLCEQEVEIELDHEMDLFMPWTPTVGTDVFSEQPIRAFQNNNIRRVPFVIGTVANEGKLFIYEAYPKPVDKLKVLEILAVLIGVDNAVKIKEQYPFPGDTDDYRDYLSAIATDGLFKCATRNATAAQVAQGNTAAYLYHFNHASSFNAKEWNVNYTCCWNESVCHGEELVYAFHVDLQPINASYTEAENGLALTLQAFWAQFANRGDPTNGGDVNPNQSVMWTPFTLNGQQSIQFQTNQIEMQSLVDVRNSKCEFWDTLNYDWIK